MNLRIHKFKNLWIYEFKNQKILNFYHDWFDIVNRLTTMCTIMSDFFFITDACLCEILYGSIFKFLLCF